MVALPSETPLIKAARAAGVKVITGAEVIALQAAEQFERYTGVRPTPEQIAAASAYPSVTMARWSAAPTSTATPGGVDKSGSDRGLFVDHRRRIQQRAQLVLAAVGVDLQHIESVLPGITTVFWAMARLAPSFV